MRVVRLMGYVLAAAAIPAAVLAVGPAIGGQTKGAKPEGQADRTLTLAAGPDVQVLGLGGPEIGVTIRDGDKGEGVIVNDVRNGSPASKAGIKAGDTIIEFDGEKVRSSRQLTRLVQESLAGRSAKIAVMRDGKRVDLAVTPEARAGGAWSGAFQGDIDQLRQELGDQLREVPRQGDQFQFGGNAYRFRMPAPGQLEMIPPEGWSRSFEGFLQPGGRLGAAVQEMTPQLATYFGAKEGVLVTAVTDGSAAAKAGLKAGDVVTAVNDKGVKTSADLVRALSEAGDVTEVAIAIVRDHKPMTVKAKLEAGTSRSRRVIRRTIIV
jgi:S1-C subfamily serine protease